jgi:TolA-binding protein
MAGRDTNAFVLFTKFIAQFPANELSARAQFWVGDYYFRQADYPNAEYNYQVVFQNTNWTSTNLAALTGEARMMAGRAAMSRMLFKDAIGYFTNLLSPDYPSNLQVEATVAYADATVSRQDDLTNRTADLNEAIRSLKTITNSQPDTWQAAQAAGRIGDCYFALGARDPDQYTNAALAYRAVIGSSNALSDAKNQARFALGAVMESQALLKSGTNQQDLLEAALGQYVNAFFQGLDDPGKPSPYWTEKSGMTAEQVAETLQDWPTVFKICKRLKELLPVLGPVCDRKIEKAMEHGASP